MSKFSSNRYLQSVTRDQVKPAADKVAEQAEPTADKANKQIKKGAQIVADNVSSWQFCGCVECALPG